ncbi:MAG: hypothetical protein Q4E53_05430 [Eubacteriales bacterium]|nr:hypothetical protein [Eubacteriales bacterium]
MDKEMKDQIRRLDSKLSLLKILGLLNFKAVTEILKKEEDHSTLKGFTLFTGIAFILYAIIDLVEIVREIKDN